MNRPEAFTATVMQQARDEVAMVVSWRRASEHVELMEWWPRGLARINSAGTEWSQADWPCSLALQPISLHSRLCCCMAVVPLLCPALQTFFNSHCLFLFYVACHLPRLQAAAQTLACLPRWCHIPLFQQQGFAAISG